MNFGQFGKAGYAFVVTFLGALANPLIGNTGFTDLTAGQWVSAVLAGLIVAGGVYGIPYVPSKAPPK